MLHIFYVVGASFFLSHYNFFISSQIFAPVPMQYEITMIEERMKQMTPNMAAIEEYKRKVRGDGLDVFTPSLC